MFIPRNIRPPAPLSESLPEAACILVHKVLHICPLQALWSVSGTRNAISQITSRSVRSPLGSIVLVIRRRSAAEVQGVFYIKHTIRASDGINVQPVIVGRMSPSMRQRRTMASCENALLYDCSHRCDACPRADAHYRNTAVFWKREKSLLQADAQPITCVSEIGVNSGRSIEQCVYPASVGRDNSCIPLSGEF